MNDAYFWWMSRRTDVQAIARRMERMKEINGRLEMEDGRDRPFYRAEILKQKLAVHGTEIRDLFDKIEVHEMSRSRSKRFASRARWLAEKDTFMEKREAFEKLHAEFKDWSQRAPFLEPDDHIKSVFAVINQQSDSIRALQEQQAEWEKTLRDVLTVLKQGAPSDVAGGG
ncbi:hypothetical protein LTR70_000570 [Exophiala xenobiotica]|uniref:Uncharacterized protein n=1 Tax=Lithohypha guttulata TaxID=1690604 RepID=A0ABR0KIQ7_9EURO|nr:hypothetical protein LTR24_002183 [Lithohypha guttulata]KAK5329421.1 hypothetical protein LTR70_000570 [Exophiala xenobiotica]